MSWQRILIASDFSTESQMALDEGLSLARRTGAAVVLVHAHEAEQPGAQADPALDEARQALAEIGESVAGTGIAISKALVTGPAADAICDAAVRMDADVVVLGTHGRTGFRRVLLGSIAERVVRYCERSVLIARRGDVHDGYRRILAPTDFSPAAENAIRLAAALAAREAALEILHCDSLPTVSAGLGAAPVLAEATRDIEAILDRRAREYERSLQRDGLTVRFQRTPGRAARVILESLDTEAYDLVALGHSQRVGIRGRTIGTVAEAVVRHARCSALVGPASGR